MPILHEVEAGEGISSLGERYGFAPDTIWNDPANAELKRLRPDGNVLLPGDRITIPDKRAKSVAVATGRVHRFRRRGIPARLRLQLFVNEYPRADEEFILEVAGRVIRGRTDAAGVLDVAVSPQAREARLVIGPESEEIRLRIGHLDPPSASTGVQDRLINLGFLFGVPPAGAEGDKVIRKAVRAFQRKAGLAVTGEADEATCSALAEAHDRTHSGETGT